MDIKRRHTLVFGITLASILALITVILVQKFKYKEPDIGPDPITHYNENISGYCDVSWGVVLPGSHRVLHIAAGAKCDSLPIEDFVAAYHEFLVTHKKQIELQMDSTSYFHFGFIKYNLDSAEIESIIKSSEEVFERPFELSKTWDNGFEIAVLE